MDANFRYPGGGYSFEEDDEGIFFGRTTAIDYLYNCILLNQSVVLYGKSGIGKSSLLKAGVIPKLLQKETNRKESKKDFRLYSLPTCVWQGIGTPALIERVRDLKLHKGTPPFNDHQFLDFLPDEVKQTLWYKFKAAQYEAAKNKTTTTYILIVDQVEEIFTYPAAQLTQFVTELANLRSPMLPDEVRILLEEYEETNDQITPSEISVVLYTPIPIKFVFSIRSDKLYLIGRLKKAIPSILQNTFELYPFTRDQAIDAIVEPSKMKGSFASFPFDVSQVTEPVIAFLLKQSKSEFEYNTCDARIEPFALQIICRYIERKIVIVGKVEKVTAKMVEDKLDTIFQNFYTEIWNDLSLDQEMELKVRTIIEGKMIYEKDRIRVPVLHNLFEDAGIDQQTLTSVIETKIIRETYPSSKSYEISHDSLVDSILKAKKDRELEEEKLNRKYDTSARNITKDLNIKVLEAEILKNPYNYQLFKYKAEYQYADQNFGEALKTYKRAIELSKIFDEDLHTGLANCYFVTGEYSLSNEELFKIIEKTPAHEFALYNIAYNYHMLKEYDCAIAYYNRVLVVKPGHKKVNYNLAIINKELGRYEQAEMYFQKVLDIYPEEYTAYMSLIDTLILSKNYERAKEWEQKLINLTKDDADTYSKIANLYVHEDNERSVNYYKKALELKPNNASYHANLGIVYSYMNQADNSIDQFRTACRLDPRNSFYHTWLGFLYQSRKDHRQAAKEFKKAVKYDPIYRYPVVALAACYRRMGKMDQYHKYIQRAQKLSPSDSDDVYSLASFEALCGNTEKALELLSEALEKKVRNLDFVKNDPDFDFIRDEPGFILLINEKKQI